MDIQDEQDENRTELHVSLRWGAGLLTRVWHNAPEAEQANMDIQDEQDENRTELHVSLRWGAGLLTRDGHNAPDPARHQG